MFDVQCNIFLQPDSGWTRSFSQSVPCEPGLGPLRLAQDGDGVGRERQPVRPARLRGVPGGQQRGQREVPGGRQPRGRRQVHGCGWAWLARRQVQSNATPPTAPTDRPSSGYFTSLLFHFIGFVFGVSCQWRRFSDSSRRKGWIDVNMHGFNPEFDSVWVRQYSNKSMTGVWRLETNYWLLPNAYLLLLIIFKCFVFSSYLTDENSLLRLILLPQKKTEPAYEFVSDSQFICLLDTKITLTGHSTLDTWIYS